MQIIGVRFKKAGKIYYFSPEGFELKENDSVIVETSRGLEFGTVIIPPKDIDEKQINQPLKPVIRIATEEDFNNLKKNEAKKAEAIEVARQKIVKHGLDMNIIDAEYTFDGAKIIFYFSSEGRVDFRELVKDLAQSFRIRIELRQIGIRDECKMLGGISPCGRQCCCSNHLSDFEHVSIKMAKNQGLSLNPSKISGLCGRLMCCLKYENDTYTKINKMMPKIDSEVTTPDGVGKVVACNMLKERVTVKIAVKELFEDRDYSLEQIKAAQTLADEIENEPLDVDNVDELKKLED